MMRPRRIRQVKNFLRKMFILTLLIGPCALGWHWEFIVLFFRVILLRMKDYFLRREQRKAPDRQSIMSRLSDLKGAATHAVSGTTAAPSVPSIARRGEWSIGSVLDVYWHFGSVGDHYLGRILCGLDPNNTNFAILPPHWIMEDPLGNSTIRDALNLMYGPILQSYSGKNENPKGIVLRCMACIVYHSDRLLETMVKYPGHDFSKIPLLHNSTLLNELKRLVTIEPTPGVMVTPTGVPPHVGLAIQVAQVLDKLDELVQQFGQHGDNLMLAVEEALDNKAWESGHVTGSRLKEILDEYRKDSIEAVDRQLTGMRAERRQVIRQGGQGHPGEQDSNVEGYEID